METPVEILLVEDNMNDAELSLYAFRKFKIANRIFIAVRKEDEEEGGGAAAA